MSLELLADQQTFETICAEITSLAQLRVTDLVRRLNIPINADGTAGSSQALKLEEAIEMHGKKVQRAFMLSLEADIIPEIERYQLEALRGGGSYPTSADTDASASHKNVMQSLTAHSSQVLQMGGMGVGMGSSGSSENAMTSSRNQQGPDSAGGHDLISELQMLQHQQKQIQAQQDLERIMEASRQLLSGHEYNNPGVNLASLLHSNCTIEAPNMNPEYDHVQWGGLNPQQQGQHAQVMNSQGMNSQGMNSQGMNALGGMGQDMYGRHGMINQRGPNSADVVPRARIRMSIDGLARSRGTDMLGLGGAGMYSADRIHPMHAHNNLQILGGMDNVRPNSSGGKGGVLQNTRLGDLPIIVQQRVLDLTQNFPIIKVTDFDEKVVTKMGFLVEAYSESECLKMLDKLAIRMRSKNSVMKNGPGYLDVAVSSHLDVLMARGTFSSASSIEDYAKKMLASTVHEELCKAVATSSWLQWDHVDQGIIQLLTKLPELGAIQRLQDIGQRSFRGASLNSDYGFVRIRM
eukprot:gene6462-3096_t